MNWKTWTLTGVILATWGIILLQFIPKKEPLLDGGGLRRDVADSARALLINQNFTELEKELERLRKDKARLPDGSWQMPYFFDGLYSPARNGDWNAHGELINAWEQAFPSSVGVKIAKAGFLRGMAGQEFRRLRDTPEQDRDELRKTAEGRLTTAGDLLDSAIVASPPWPEAYNLKISMGQGLTYEQRKELLQQAAKVEPSYYEFYFNLLWQYAPRRGKPPDNKTLAEYVDWCSSIAGGEGKAVYARLAAAASRFYEDDFYAASQLEWPRVRDGFNKMTGKYSRSIRLKNHFCRLACLGGDKGLAKRLFEEIGQNIDNEAWRGGDDVRKWRAWAGVKEPK